MFYNPDVLVRGKRGLALVWLAATIGSRSAIRRLSKKDFASVDISKTCESVISPSEPMALRLSSQLMFGVVRIYVQQTEQWMSDVTYVHGLIRKLVTSVTAPERTAAVAAAGDLDMPTGRRGAPAEAITLSAEPTFYSGEFEWDWTWEAVAAAAPEEALAEPTLEVTPARRAPHIAAAEEITLRRRRLGPGFEETTEEIGLGRAIEGELAEPTGLGLETAELGAPEEGLLDLGLVEPGMPPAAEIGLEGRPVSPEVTTSPGMPPIQYGEEGFDFGFEGFEELPPGAVEPVPRVSSARPVLKRPAEEVPEADIEALAEGAAPRRPKKAKVKFAREDPRLELSDEEMRASRANYNEVMERQRTAAEVGKIVKWQDGESQSLVLGPSEAMRQAPLLIDFFQLTVGAQLHDLDELHLAHKKGEVPAEVTPATEEVEEEIGRAREPSVPPTFEGFGEEGEMPGFEEAPFPPPEEGVPGEPSIEIARRGVSPRVSEAALPWMRRPEAEREETVGSVRAASIASISTVEPAGLRARLPSVEMPPPEEVEEREASIESSQQVREQMESEQESFFNFARDTADQVKPQPLFFSDLAPVADSLPTVAAQAFYHVLALTTADRLKVKQEEPYGEIEIGFRG